MPTLKSSLKGKVSNRRFDGRVFNNNRILSVKMLGLSLLLGEKVAQR